MYALTEDQRLLSATARDFAAEFLAPNAVRWDQTEHLPVDVLRKAAEVGMGGMHVRAGSGGAQLSRLESALVFEALATGCPAVAAYLSIHNMVGWLIDRYADARQRADWLPGLCSMQWLASYCLTEPGAGSDAAALRTKAVRDGDGYRLSGVKQFISGAGEADLYLVMARTGGPGAGGISAFAVRAGSPGLSFGAPEAKMGWHAQPTRQVVLDEVPVPAGQRIGAEGDGFRMAMRALNGGRLNIAACSLGGAQEALDRTVRYLGQREAFGAPLAESSALQFRLADMATELEAGRMLLWRAADALDADEPRAPVLCAMAKRFCTDAGFEVANEALQLHGGYGYLAAYGIEKIVRDLRVHQIVEGTNEIMRRIVARELVGTAR
jgi:alkylation response protein AidB-like acyl-CoA dehydrogenase